MQRDLIVFGEDWGKLPSSTQHLIKHLQKTRKVLWVNSIGLRRPRLTWRDIKRVFEKLLAKEKKTSTTEQTFSTQFNVLNPKTIPVPKSRLMRRFASYVLAKQINPLATKMGMNAPILWTSLPTAVDMIGRLNESQVVYYCGDDFGGLAGVDHEVVEQREQLLVQRADVILVSSEALQKKLASSNTYLLPHGVDYQLFSHPALVSKLLPQGKPIAGFYGSISQWLHQPLLASVISKMPDWNFVFVGKPVVDISQLTQFPNVFVFAEVAHDELPQFSQHWQVSLLPFVDNEQIRACNPLKLREYLATGKPVISTDFPALIPYKEFVSVVDNDIEMIDAIYASAYSEINYEQQALVSEEDWSYRANQVEILLSYE